MPKIKSYKSVGLQQAYDIEVDHPDHQFYLANGLLTSNSHAVSYAIDSYMCAWLLTHYEAEWLCAYVETQAGQPDKRSKAISELKRILSKNGDLFFVTPVGKPRIEFNAHRVYSYEQIVTNKRRVKLLIS